MGYMKNIAIDIENGERLGWVPLMHEDMDELDAYSPEWAGDDVELLAVMSRNGDSWIVRDGRNYPATRAFVEWIISK